MPGRVADRTDRSRRPSTPDRSERIAQSIPSESRKFRTLIEIADVVAVTTPTAPSGSSPTQNASAGPLPRTGSPHGGPMSWRDGWIMAGMLTQLPLPLLLAGAVEIAPGAN